VRTEIGRKVHDTLDYALETRCMVLIDGLARTGKTFATKHWCDLHPGEARYVQVPSTNDRKTFFRAIALSLGVSVNLKSKAQELQERVEDVLQRGDLLVVFDEASFLWPNTNLREAMPERIQWVMTALVNYGVPVAMIATPQFFRTQRLIEQRTCWTAEQFTGRIGHYESLPGSLSEQDLAAVARVLLPEGDKKSIVALVLYAQASGKYLAGIESAVRRARFLARHDGRNAVVFGDIKSAVRSVIPSDAALAQALSEPVKGVRKGPCKPPAISFQRGVGLTTSRCSPRFDAAASLTKS
jgi:hypothetical protein